jgi:hypothetical protein
MTKKIKIQRSQCYATVRDAHSFNYRWSEKLPQMASDSSIWWNLCADHGARPAFFEYIKSGKTPDYSENIRWAEDWLAENAHKPGWEGTAASYQKTLNFLRGGYKVEAEKWEYCEVHITVETVEPYKFGAFDVPCNKAVGFEKGNAPYSYVESGYLKK